MTEVFERACQLAEAITTFVDEADPLSPCDSAHSEQLDLLTHQVFQFQYQTSGPYRRLCEGRGKSPDQLDHWTDIPPVPTSAFKLEGLSQSPWLLDRPDGSVEIFRSSGTTLGEATRSVHINPFPDLYRAIIDRAYPAYCLPKQRFTQAPPTLSLVPARDQIADSSLGFMADHVLTHHADWDSVVAFDERGVATQIAITFLEDRIRDGRACLIFTTAFALVELLEVLDRNDTKLALPEGSAIFETGGFKGRTREITRLELLERTAERLSVSAQSVVREYGMTELSSQTYSGSLLGADPELLMAPPWLRVAVLDPMTLAPVLPGARGLLAFFDLGNVGSYACVLTEDMGQLDGSGFLLHGRASGSDLRGCSLTVEELRLGV